jgi:hypothetical protein
MFEIRPKTIWPAQRQLGDRSSRGYRRSQFEAAWRAYCPAGDTPTQTNKIICLPDIDPPHCPSDPQMGANPAR